MAHPVEIYLKAMQTLRSSGGTRKETSFYTPLANLIDTVGASLTPNVFCVSQVIDTGSGSPDFGLYTSNQRQRGKDGELISGVLPERGVIEVKGVADDAWLTASGEQVTRYWGKYGQVLVTNYRDFLLVGRDEDGQWATLESFRLAQDANDFWQKTANPRSTVMELGDRLLEYLKRVLLSVTILTEPEDVAWLLASYARDAKSRMDAQGDLPGLQVLREGMEAALGMKFSEASGLDRRDAPDNSTTLNDQTSKGERFFRSTLVQTLFYGVFSSWVLWARGRKSKRNNRFDWRSAAWNLHVPMIANLFSQLVQPEHLQPLGLDEVMDWTGSVLNRIDRDVFFGKFEEEHAVQYFYEPFLRAYDPELRKDLGVWYTPPEIVKYQVERVDTILREELDIEDGLADPSVYVLDPCCGTGAYLVEALRKIHSTLDAGGAGAMTAARLKDAAKKRLFGFEILPAPFVIAHLQLGLMLRHAGAPLNEKHKERIGVYLTNALTGWEPAKEPKTKILFPELEAERAAADHVKQDNPILVILGNPPYNAFAGVSPNEEDGLVEAYKEGLISEWKIKKFNLDDLYVRFFRVAERRVIKSGKGIVSFISNYSWSSEPSFVVLRKQLAENFDKIWIENLHGNRKITEYAPDGKTSETIFAIPGFSEGIQQGVVTSLWVKTGKKEKGVTVYYRDDLHDARAVDRRTSLLASLKAKDFNSHYESFIPTMADRYSFRPGNIQQHYRDWPSLVDLCAVPPMNGLMEKRGGALIDIDRSALEERMRTYFDSNLDWENYCKKGYGLEKAYSRFKPLDARKKALAREEFDPQRIVRYSVRPFDTRWCYYTGVRPIWNEPRPDLWAQCKGGNCFLVSRPAGVASPEGLPLGFSTILGDNDALRGHAYYFPLYFYPSVAKNRRPSGRLFASLANESKHDMLTANLSPLVRNYLAEIGIQDPDVNPESAALIWHHALAICCSPSYLSENADGLRADWPRIPLAKTKKILIASAKLGQTVAALMDSNLHVNSVMSGKISTQLRVVAVLHKIDNMQIDPNSDDLNVTAGWGHFGKANAVMPGRGHVQRRPVTIEEQKTMGKAVDYLYPNKETLDIYLNNVVCWKNIPEPVWEFVIGGYQVIKKWLSYREYTILGRNITLDEVGHVTATARRLTSLCLLAKELDDNYCANRNQ